MQNTSTVRSSNLINTHTNPSSQIDDKVNFLELVSWRATKRLTLIHPNNNLPNLALRLASAQTDQTSDIHQLSESQMSALRLFPARVPGIE